MPILTLMNPSISPPNYWYPPLIKWFKTKPTYPHLLAPPFYRFDVKYQPLLLNKPPPIWIKIGKSSKTGQEKKSFISTFACFLLLLPKFNFWKGEWTLGYGFTEIWDVLNIFLFSKILSLKLFGNSWGNSYTKSEILDIMFCFTC